MEFSIKVFFIKCDQYADYCRFGYIFTVESLIVTSSFLLRQPSSIARIEERCNNFWFHARYGVKPVVYQTEILLNEIT